MDLPKALNVWLKLMNFMVITPVTIENGHVEILNARRYHVFCFMVSCVNVVFSLLSLFLYVLAIGIRTLPQVLYTFSVCLIFLNCLCRIFTGYNGNKRRLRHALEGILEVDRNMARLGSVENWTGFFMTVVLELFCVGLVHFYRIYLSYVYYQRFSIWTLLSPHFFYFLQTFDYYNYLWLACKHFKTINNVLSLIKHDLHQKPTQEKNLTNTLTILKKCYEKTEQSIVLINPIFELQNLNYLLTMFIETTVIIFFFVKKMLNMNLNHDTSVFLRYMILLWPLGLLFLLAVVLIKCNEIRSEAERTVDLFHGIGRICRTRMLKEKVFYSILRTFWARTGRGRCGRVRREISYRIYDFPTRS